MYTAMITWTTSDPLRMEEKTNKTAYGNRAHASLHKDIVVKVREYSLK